MIVEITTRSYTSIDAILAAYQRYGVTLSWWAEDLIQKVSISDKQEIKKIKILSSTELGLPNKALDSDIYQQAISSGLKRITAETALLLAFLDLNQTKDNGILSGMEPIRLTDGDPMIFRLAKKSLTASFALPGQMMWDSQIKWAFEMLQ